MAKMTLLEMVQDILSDLTDDEVNSINDTLESLQIAQIVKTTYLEMMSNKNWPHLRTLGKLDPSVDVSKPTHMKVQEDWKELEWVEYNCRTEANPTRNIYKSIPYKSPDEFLRLTSQYDNTRDTVTEVEDYSGVTLHIKNDRHPEFWTSFDDEHLVFNSYNSTLDDTLQKTHTRVSVFREPSWSMVNDFVPDLPTEAFSALLAEAKSVAFVVIKQQANNKAEQQSVRQRNWLSRKAWTVNGGIKLPNYARRSRK